MSVMESGPTGHAQALRAGDPPRDQRMGAGGAHRIGTSAAAPGRRARASTVHTTSFGRKGSNAREGSARLASGATGPAGLAARGAGADLCAPMEPMRSMPAAATAEAAAPAPAPVHTEFGLLLMVGIWAVNFSVVKLALGEIPPLAFNALRFPLASLAVWLVLRLRGRIPLPRREDARAVLALGVLGNVVYQLLFIFGIDRTRAGNAALLLAGTPILTALLSAALGHERVGLRVWAGVLATVAGMALVVAGGPGGVGLGLETLAGDLTMVGASVAWSMYTVGARRLIERYGSVPVTAWTLWIGTAGLILLGIRDLAALDVATVSPATWAAVAYAGVLGIGLAYLLWYRGVRYIGNTRTATYSNLTPVLALGVAWLWLGEVPGVWQAVGAAVIIGGVSLAQRARR